MTYDPSDIMECPFDFQRYIGQRLQEIDDLEERRFAKKLLIDDFSNVIKVFEYKYKELENCIYKEKENTSNQYTISTTIGNCEHYESSNPFFPICSEDLDMDLRKEMLSSVGLIYLESIYLQLSKEECQKFERQEKRIGCMVDQESSQLVYVLIRPAERYKKAIEWLYRLFQDNQLPWVTVNTGHLEKFYDVFLCVSDGNIDKNVKDIEIDWGDYSRAVCRGFLPFWNVQLVPFDSVDFKASCVDGVYEHVFSIDAAEGKEGYLIEKNKDIMKISREKNRILLMSMQKTFEKWLAVRIIFKHQVFFQYNDYPVLTNFRKESFLGSMAQTSRIHLMTKADLCRRIMEFDIQDYIEFIGYEIHENGKDYPIVAGMNWFVQDELFPMESRRILLLMFKEKKTRHYLSDRMMQFAVSQLQLEITEYRCVGVMG